MILSLSLKSIRSVNGVQFKLEILKQIYPTICYHDIKNELSPVRCVVSAEYVYTN